MKIKVESFTNPITEDVLQKKDFNFPSGSGCSGGTTNNFNFNAGISNIVNFQEYKDSGNLPTQFDFTYTANPEKKGMLFVNLTNAISPISGFPALVINIYLNGNQIGNYINGGCFAIAGLSLLSSNTISIVLSVSSGQASLNFANVYCSIMEV